MSCFNTCFFERYAYETLRRCLGHDFDELVNRDRPDLQSPDGKTWGIEVTRAMEESERAADKLLDSMSGLTQLQPDREDLAQFRRNGYGYGLNVGHRISESEYRYWSLALPLKRILESKLSKLSCGLYGEFQKNGLYVFIKDILSEDDVRVALRFMLHLQEYSDIKYDILFLSEVNALHVCNLTDGIADSYRISSYPLTIDLRREIYDASFE